MLVVQFLEELHLIKEQSKNSKVLPSLAELPVHCKQRIYSGEITMELIAIGRRTELAALSRSPGLPLTLEEKEKIERRKRRA